MMIDATLNLHIAKYLDPNKKERFLVWLGNTLVADRPTKRGAKRIADNLLRDIRKTSGRRA